MRFRDRDYLDKIEALAGAIIFLALAAIAGGVLYAIQ
jgi:hypothetical protein